MGRGSAREGRTEVEGRAVVVGTAEEGAAEVAWSAPAVGGLKEGEDSEVQRAAL